MKRAGAVLGLAAISLLLAGCFPELNQKPKLLAITTPPPSIREMQSRRFDTPDEKKMLAASAAVMQDLGFTIEDSCQELGLIVVSKDRSAYDSHQAFGAILVAALLGTQASVDDKQLFRASVVTRPADDGNAIIVRVIFQRTVWDQTRQVKVSEEMNNPAQYKEFFQKLSKAVFLQANNL